MDEPLPLRALGRLSRDPEPWAEGGKIPWDEPGFSRRMLAEHLDQAHDLASRREAKIEEQVRFLDSLVARRPARVLDLGCGPGLYANRLARLGHECVGIDFSPASVEHAAAEAERDGLSCDFRQEDLRSADFGAGFDLVLLLYGEWDVFPRADARAILSKARAALRPGGTLVLEPQTEEAVRRQGGAGTSWHFVPGGLFSPRPHLLLLEGFWREEERVATTRFVVVDAESAQFRAFSECVAAWSREEIEAACRDAGFDEVLVRPGLGGEADPDLPDLFAVVAGEL